ncbi:MAG: hypothetical protein KA085_17270 [Phenylobacterium sp.]|uniref:hypothetical protein n=1 Tax=Phenylobacterium sp. TaxID=1871053 RepID=UPI001B40FAA1|nr:hypothetical protein [Phenylobacterium sp.]MBP7817870.1 hypothetical protein [Phenylobacterium sp.]MBP9231479.1 hypothetical protein [Phenylobacterium sp.]
MTGPSESSRASRLGPGLILLWAGLTLGVAFLATPAKFLAPSLSLTVALDVGRQTFHLYNRVEIGLLLGLVGLGAISTPPRGWWLALAVPAGVILTQSLWLLPRLDARVAAIIAGAVPPPSPLHVIYIAAEGLKTLWLLAFGLGGLSPQTEGASWLRAATLPDLTPAHTKD